ncbi:MAG TPA: sigma 54-interacting transcriptional regulator [Myxococcales bacterium]|jgi:DNA-binding NtrC family response regulator
MAELVFFRRAEELMRVQLEGRRITVGRAENNDIQVPDPAVSRQQFAVEKKEGAFRLVDLSGKGTEVAGKRVSDAALADGADVGLAQWRAVFHAESGSGVLSEATLAEDRDRGTVVQPRSAADVSELAVRLHVVARGAERVLPFRDEATVGSGERASVQLDDPFVSATHARLERSEGGFKVVDLSSKNGTFVGAARVLEAIVPLGCPVRVGQTELVLKKPEKTDTGVPLFEGMVGGGDGMRKVYETIERVAPAQAAVAIFGESGSGKELVARALHQRSSRAAKPFVPVNCGALSKELVESELFGHEKGAFTGAEKMHKGAFEEADGGTLFLDEIGELPLTLQAKLLRALELGEIKRVGASRPMNVDVRIVAATNRDLRAEIRRGAFREDLYWRLCVVPIQLPPLRARRGDLALLIRHFLKAFSPANATVALTKSAEAKLGEHSWPGNVRELKNVVHRSLLLRRAEQIDADDIQFEPAPTQSVASEESGGYDPHREDPERVYILNKSLDDLDDEIFLKTWKRLSARPAQVAKALGQSRGAIYRRMEKLGIPTATEASESKEE